MVRGRKNPLHVGFARRLRRARRAAGLTVTTLAARAGLASSTTITVLETQRTVPRVETAEKLARALGVLPGFLAYGLESAEGGAGYVGLAERLRAARMARGLAKQPLDELADVAKGTVANTEAGRSQPRVDTAEKLAKILGVSPAWLAFGEGPQPLKPSGESSARL